MTKNGGRFTRRWGSDRMNETLDRRKLTFKQAEGLEELPRPLDRNSLSPRLRAKLWEFYYKAAFYGYQLRDWSLYVLKDEYVELLHQPITKFPHASYEHSERLEKLFIKGEFAEVMQHLQFVLRHRFCPKELRNLVEFIFTDNQAAWKLLYEGEETTFIPSSNVYEVSAIDKAYKELKQAEFGGGKTHLINASEALAQGKWNDSIRESISAVESVAKKICNDPNADLSKALSKLEQSGTNIHGALKNAFNNMYGYTSDEKGIRHSLVEQGHQCDQADAQFMLGACASFISYLFAKAKIS
jgi:hypothetical protein